MQTNAGAKKFPPKLHCYRVRLRGLPKGVGCDFVFEKVIACFKLHQRALYQAPDFILCDVAPFGRNLDLLVKTTSKELLFPALENTSYQSGQSHAIREHSSPKAFKVFRRRRVLSLRNWL